MTGQETGKTYTVSAYTDIITERHVAVSLRGNNRYLLPDEPSPNITQIVIGENII